jgi:hypothetical protein
VALFILSPAGNVTVTPIEGAEGGASIPSVIPDGNGGVLVSNDSTTGVIVSDIAGSGGTAAFGSSSGLGETSPDMVLGDNGAYFINLYGESGGGITAIDEATGNQLWTWTASSGNLEIIAATAGGGVAVTNTLPNGQENVVMLDANGNPTYETWGTAGGLDAYGVLSNSSYYSNGLWVGTSPDPVIEGMIGDGLEVALSPWGWGQAGGTAGGDQQGQALSDPSLKLVGVSDCVTASSGSQTQFERFPSYRLQTGKNQSPSSNYTVFEVLSPYKQLAQCVDKNGNPTGSSPCTYVGGNRFDDDLFIAPQTKAFVNNQSFRYGLSGQRLWNVRTIERTTKSLSTLQIVQVPANNGDHLVLSLTPLQEPLIDGTTSPYVGPNCKTPPIYPYTK